MPRRARLASYGAFAGVVAMAATWFAAHEIALLRRVDVNILAGFLSLRSPRVERIASFFISLCNPQVYVFLAAVPIAIALVRGRRRVAVALFALLAGANETTELLKPLAAGPRDAVPVIGVSLTHATWPSGHSTASMALALAVIISVPARLRPLVATVMAAFVVGVVYSLLATGAHYPSDVLGGFEVACVWSLLALAALWTYEARRSQAVTDTESPSRLSPLQAFAPSLVMVVCAVAFGVVFLLARHHEAVAYLTYHKEFVIGAAAIAIASFSCASGLSFFLRRPAKPLSGSGPAPTAALGRRSRPG